jgi:hypothetical protein
LPQETAIEFLFEIIAQLVLEVVTQVLFELLTAFGWRESMKHSVRREDETTPVLAAFGHFLMGLAAGAISVAVIPQRIVPLSPVPGISLILSPVGTGVVMHWIGEFWRARGRERLALFSFRAGAIFAFGMALVRFLYIELG